MAQKCRAVRQSDSQANFPSKAPGHTAATCGDAGYLSIEMLLKGVPPGHELESKPVVNHGKPT
jgi:hypothetical protein